MKSINKLLSAVALTLCPLLLKAESFEKGCELASWKIDNGSLELSEAHAKLGKNALRIAWKGGAVVKFCSAEDLEKAAKSRNGGIELWIYNEIPAELPATVRLVGKDGKQLGAMAYRLDFTGWRCLWARFADEMGYDRKAGKIAGVEFVFPETVDGCTYFDMLNFTPKVNWQIMSNAQYDIVRTDFSLVMDFIGYRNAVPEAENVIAASDDDIKLIQKRMRDWYLGAGLHADNAFVKARTAAEKRFIREGVKRAEALTPGRALFPMYVPDRIEGEKVQKFREINEYILLPLALDYCKNGNEASLKRVFEIYDWYNDQGWADGSAMGTLTFEKLRSTGYYHSYALLNGLLPEETAAREAATMSWYSIFGMCNRIEPYKGEVADNLRATALAKLAYALSLRDSGERQAAMSAFTKYMDSALGLASGYYGTFKKDYSGYHHRGPYNSAYYPHALYAGALIAYLLHGTPYALDAEVLDNIRNGLLAFAFICAGNDTPAGTCGRFPKGTGVLAELLPAFAYAALSYDEPDAQLLTTMANVLKDDGVREAFDKYVRDVNSILAYTSSVGEMELVAEAMKDTASLSAETPVGHVFMPYSGLLVEKDERFHFNLKGYSAYIWDFESSASENLYGRYLSYGQIEYIDSKTGRRSFNPADKDFDWNYIPGTTSKVLLYKELEGKGGAFAGHRNFSDETFLAGVDGCDEASMFSVRLHDINYDPSLRADKSVFFFDDFAICLGSGICSSDTEHKMVTTLFQSFDREARRADKTGLCTDGSLYYAVKSGRLVYENAGNNYTRAYIDHGNSPAGAAYEYYIVKSGKKRAKQLLGRKSPVKVLRQDGKAHIVSYGNYVSAAVFAAGEKLTDCLVSEVSLPMAYVLENGSESSVLHFCEPDMRRGTKRHHMGELTMEDVLADELPAKMEITLNGLFEVEEITAGHKASGAVNNSGPCRPEVRYSDGRTIVTVTTVRAGNHSLRLTRK
ncbi:MAG: chondroitinase family polysaccharide lyase [Candidatus Cryptobacteroides sp.]